MARHESLGTDPDYLRDVQYKDPANLDARITLHAKHSWSAEPWYPWLAARIEWPPRADVLEVGCGSGRLWVNIVSLLPSIRLTLTDLSEGMVAAARRAVSSLSGVELVGARTCDAQDLPFADRTFDVAVANHMLYHVPDPGRAAAELARVLRPTGVLLAATNGPRHLDAVSDLQRQVFGSSPSAFVGRRFGKDNGADVLGTAFGHVRWHQHESELVCTDPEDVYAFIASTSLAQAFPERMATLRDVVDARFEAGGGALRAATDSGCFVASKPCTHGTTRGA
jgi:SAM-dependent methyltransferase